MVDEVECPICLNAEDSSCRLIRGGRFEGVSEFDCDICGTYQLTKDAYFDLGAGDNNLSYLKPEPKIATILSYKVRQLRYQNKGSVAIISRDRLKGWRSSASFPSRALQAKNLILFIGDNVSETGEDIEILPRYIHAVIGARSFLSVRDLLLELKEEGITKCSIPRTIRPRNSHGLSINYPGGENVNLTLKGWDKYEAEKRNFSGGIQGFMAMKFNDPELDSFVNDTVKPATKEIGYDLVDMRDVARAGVIDNIMRTQIRDSAFVIVDLTHDNSGAYWEAGYAEGLGKLVVYICEKTKFEEASTHFDTNHCTTVPWSSDDPEGFRRELIATLRRSLDLR